MYNKFPCYYPGDFNPPTKYHLNTMEWLLGRPEIGHVYIVVGNDDPNQLVQEKKIKLWEMLIRRSFSPNVSILRAKEGHALNEIKHSLDKKKETPFFIAMDEKMARNRKMQEHFGEFPNFQIEIIPSQFNKSSEQMIQAVLDRDDKTVKSLLPAEFNDQSVDDYVGIMKQSKDMEAPDEKSPAIDYKTHYINKFNDGFWKEVFAPIAEEEVNEIDFKKAAAVAAMAAGLTGAPKMSQAQDKAPTTQTYSKGYENQKPDKEMATKMLGVGTSIEFNDTKKDAAMVAVMKYCMGIRDGKMNMTPKQFLGSDEFMSRLTGKEMIAMYNTLYKTVSDLDEEGQETVLNKGNSVTAINENISNQ